MIGCRRHPGHYVSGSRRAAGFSNQRKWGATALVIDEKNIARLRVLKTGQTVGGDWQVLDGLKPGDKMIVEGLQKAQPDMPVTPAPAQTVKS